MIKYLLLAFIFCSNFCMYGQRNDTKNKGVKVFTKLEFSNFQGSISERNTIEYGSLGFAYFQEGRDWLHEYELTRFDLRNDNIKADTTNAPWLLDYERRFFEIGLQYSLSRKFNLSEKSKIFVGLGAELFYDRERETPAIAGRFPVTLSNLGIDTKLLFRYNYQITDKFFLDFYVPIPVYKFFREYGFVENPAVQFVQQEQIFYNHNFFDGNLQFKIGLGVLFQKGNFEQKTESKKRKSRRKK